MNGAHPLPQPARVLVLNGTSSSGKTALAKAMQSCCGAPQHHVGLDAFRDMEPPGYWNGWAQWDTRTAELRMRALCGAICAAVGQYARHGQQVVLDIALTNPLARRLVVQHLLEWPAYLIAVRCSLDEIVRREQGRGDRPHGLAASQFDWIHTKMRYDLEIDTTGRSPEEAAAELFDRLEGLAPVALGELDARWKVA